MPATPAVFNKKFVLKHTFKDVSNMVEDVRKYSEWEEHFGASWRFYISRNDDHLAVFLSCEKTTKTGENCSIETNFKFKTKEQYVWTRAPEGTSVFKVNSPSSFGFFKCLTWTEMKKYYLKKDSLTLEVYVTIKKTSGFHGAKLRNFDEKTMKQVSDMILSIDGNKFYVSKLFLASQSPYFMNLFLVQSNNEATVKLTNIDPDDFQKYLEVLYGEPAVDDSTVEGLLVLADFLKTPSVIRRCEEFLIHNSKMSLKITVEMANRYELETVKRSCFDSVKTKSDIRTVLPSDLGQVNRATLEALLRKSAVFG